VRPQYVHLGLELQCPLAQLGTAEFAGGGSHSLNEIRDADAKLRQDVLLSRFENGFGEPAGTEQLPEPVPGRAKCRPSSPESVPGLIPQKRTRRSGPTRSARARSMKRMYPAEGPAGRRGSQKEHSGQWLLRGGRAFRCARKT